MVEKQLSLLIIDLGGSCVVKVEKGRVEFMDVDGGKVTLATDATFLSRQPFDKLRTAIDGEKPVPRIEQGLPCGDPTAYYLTTKSDKMLTIYPHEFNALCKIAGHQLPIYEGGTWMQIGVESDGQRAESLSIWRYER